MAEEWSTKVLIISAIVVYITVFVLLYITAIPAVLNPDGSINYSQVALLSLYITGIIAGFFFTIRWVDTAFADPKCLPACDAVCPLPAPVAPAVQAPPPVPAIQVAPPEVRTVYVPRTTYVAETELVTPEPEEIRKLRDANKTVEEARRQIASLQEGINEVIL